MATTVRRRVGAGCLAWVLGLGVAAAVAHPRAARGHRPGQRPAAAQAGVDWIGTNQAADGRFLYRYDRDARRSSPATTPSATPARCWPSSRRGRRASPGGRPRPPSGHRLGPRRAHRAAGRPAGVHRRHRRDRPAGGRAGGAPRGDGDDHPRRRAPPARPVPARRRSPTTARSSPPGTSTATSPWPGRGRRSSPARSCGPWPASTPSSPARAGTSRPAASRATSPPSATTPSAASRPCRTTGAPTPGARWRRGRPPRLTDDELDYAERQAGLFGLQVRYESQRRAAGSPA